MSKYKPDVPRVPEVQEELPMEQFSSGFRRDGPPLSLPLASAARMSGLRFKRRGVHKDWAPLRVGQAAPSKIRALGEYKVISGDIIHQRTHRLFLLDNVQFSLDIDCYELIWIGNDEVSKIRIYVWGKAEEQWPTADDHPEPIERFESSGTQYIGPPDWGEDLYIQVDVYAGDAVHQVWRIRVDHRVS